MPKKEQLIVTKEDFDKILKDFQVVPGFEHQKIPRQLVLTTSIFVKIDLSESIRRHARQKINNLYSGYPVYPEGFKIDQQSPLVEAARSLERQSTILVDVNIYSDGTKSLALIDAIPKLEWWQDIDDDTIASGPYSCFHSGSAPDNYYIAAMFKDELLQACGDFGEARDVCEKHAYINKTI